MGLTFYSQKYEKEGIKRKQQGEYFVKLVRITFEAFENNRLQKVEPGLKL